MTTTNTATAKSPNMRKYRLHYFAAITITALALLSAPAYATSIHEELVEAMLSILDQQKQQIFDAVHPVGKAKRVKLHELTIKWKNDKESNREEDILAITVRYTLYWEGPITTDGYTKISSTLDTESERWSGQVLATNGTTNDEVGEAVVNIGGAVIADWLNNQNQ